LVSNREKYKDGKLFCNKRYDEVTAKNYVNRMKSTDYLNLCKLEEFFYMYLLGLHWTRRPIWQLAMDAK
jgi:hypothetical protein